MVQSGIAYAAGQLLAVVAPRTVLVVDAPTDWSLAGPLWELALDDAPVDEILDVLIRRGIRTAPSFAIVRVESDAVRALVRGSVPVCFERVGEPVRLDATGATTWLEGLISGARRVLVGAVETNTKLPYLVSTGVVLVSGLALPCAPADPDNRRGGGVSTSDSSPVPQPSGDAPAEEESIFNPPVPVSSGNAGSGNTARFAPVAGREPRVVDLTRSESRPPVAPARSFTPAPEPRESWAMASKWSGPDRSAGASRPEVNGHAPSVLDPEPVTEAESPSEPESRSSSTPSAFEPPSSYRAPAAFQAPVPSAFQAPTPFAPSTPSGRSGDDPGELHDMDDAVTESEAPAAPAEETAYSPAESLDSSESRSSEGSAPSEAKVFSFPDSDRGSELFARNDEFPRRDEFARKDERSGSDPFARNEQFARSDEPPRNDPFARNDQQAREQYDQGPADQAGDRNRDSRFRPVGRSDDSLDDLLIDPSEDEAPPSPAPTDLPNFEPPAVALPLPAALNGSSPAVPAQPRGFGGVPAGWPPAQEPTAKSEESSSSSLFVAPSYGSPQETNDEVDYADSQQSADESSDQPPLGELPLRVRGRSLRPEHSTPPPNDDRLLGRSPASPPPASPPMPPFNSIPPLRSLSDTRFGSDPVPADQQARSGEPDSGANGKQASDDSPASGGLQLPSFFRGTRGPRKDSNDQSSEPSARESNDEAPSSAGPVPWAQSGANSAAPAAWVPPVRRGVPDNSGFNGGPPAMPGVLRPSSPAQNAQIDDDADDELEELPTERTVGPNDTPAEGMEYEQAHEPLREPPRLLGVWCDAGHVTSPDNSECRVCGLPVPPQAPILVARPPLGVLIFDNGDRVEVDRPVVLGRDPKAISSSDPEPPILHPVASATGQVSRTHAEIRADGWDVVLTDLDAMNGTALTLPGTSPMAIEPGVPTLITPGARVDLGGETGFVFEVEG
jgi:hypothetical protein